MSMAAADLMNELNFTWKRVGAEEPEVKKEKEKESKGLQHFTTFPWLHGILRMCREILGTNQKNSFDGLLFAFVKELSISVKDCYSRPNRALKLRDVVCEFLVYFDLVYQDFKSNYKDRNRTYLNLMTELLAIYMDLEIKASKRGLYSLKKTGQFMALALRAYLGQSEDHMVEAILRAKLITKSVSELCVPVLFKILNDSKCYITDENAYARFLLAFKLLQKITRRSNRRFITKMAASKLRPAPELVDIVRKMTNIFPAQKTRNESITTFLMNADFSYIKAKREFLRTGSICRGSVSDLYSITSLTEGSGSGDSASNLLNRSEKSSQSSSISRIDSYSSDKGKTSSSSDADLDPSVYRMSSRTKDSEKDEDCSDVQFLCTRNKKKQPVILITLDSDEETEESLKKDLEEIYTNCGDIVIVTDNSSDAKKTNDEQVGREEMVAKKDDLSVGANADDKTGESQTETVSNVEKVPESDENLKVDNPQQISTKGGDLPSILQSPEHGVIDSTSNFVDSVLDQCFPSSKTSAYEVRSNSASDDGRTEVSSSLDFVDSTSSMLNEDALKSKESEISSTREKPCTLRTMEDDISHIMNDLYNSLQIDPQGVRKGFDDINSYQTGSADSVDSISKIGCDNSTPGVQKIGDVEPKQKNPDNETNASTGLETRSEIEGGALAATEQTEKQLDVEKSTVPTDSSYQEMRESLMENPSETSNSVQQERVSIIHSYSASHTGSGTIQRRDGESEPNSSITKDTGYQGVIKKVNYSGEVQQSKIEICGNRPERVLEESPKVLFPTALSQSFQENKGQTTTGLKDCDSPQNPSKSGQQTMTKEPVSILVYQVPRESNEERQKAETGSKNFVLTPGNIDKLIATTAKKVNYENVAKSYKIVKSNFLKTVNQPETVNKQSEDPAEKDASQYKINQPKFIKIEKSGLIGNSVIVKDGVKFVSQNLDYRKSTSDAEKKAKEDCRSIPGVSPAQTGRTPAEKMETKGGAVKIEPRVSRTSVPIIFKKITEDQGSEGKTPERRKRRSQKSQSGEATSSTNGSNPSKKRKKSQSKTVIKTDINMKSTLKHINPSSIPQFAREMGSDRARKIDVIEPATEALTKGVTNYMNVVDMTSKVTVERRPPFQDNFLGLQSNLRNELEYGNGMYVDPSCLTTPLIPSSTIPGSVQFPTSQETLHPAFPCISQEDSTAHSRNREFGHYGQRYSSTAVRPSASASSSNRPKTATATAVSSSQRFYPLSSAVDVHSVKLESQTFVPEVSRLEAMYPLDHKPVLVNVNPNYYNGEITSEFPFMPCDNVNFPESEKKEMELVMSGNEPEMSQFAERGSESCAESSEERIYGSRSAGMTYTSVKSPPKGASNIPRDFIIGETLPEDVKDEELKEFVDPWEGPREYFPDDEEYFVRALPDNENLFSEEDFFSNVLDGGLPPPPPLLPPSIGQSSPHRSGVEPLRGEDFADMESFDEKCLYDAQGERELHDSILESTFNENFFSENVLPLVGQHKVLECEGSLRTDEKLPESFVSCKKSPEGSVRQGDTKPEAQNKKGRRTSSRRKETKRASTSRREPKKREVKRIGPSARENSDNVDKKKLRSDSVAYHTRSISQKGIPIEYTMQTQRKERSKRTKKAT